MPSSWFQGDAPQQGKMAGEGKGEKAIPSLAN